MLSADAAKSSPGNRPLFQLFAGQIWADCAVPGYLRWREVFAEALDQRLYTIRHLDEMLRTEAARLWSSDTAAIVAEIRTFPTGAKAVCGLIAAGELEEIERLIPLAEQWGAENGCRFGMIESRPGWAKRMKRHGYETFQVSLIKPL